MRNGATARRRAGELLSQAHHWFCQSSTVRHGPWAQASRRGDLQL